MIVACPACRSRYRFNETKLGSRPRARTKCAKCGAAIEIENPLVGGVTLPPEDVFPPPEPPPMPAAADDTQKRPVITSQDPTSTQSGTGPQAVIADLPRDKRYSLAVIQGPATGTIFQITRSRVTVGRSGADIVIDDPEASRQHAEIEVLGDHAALRDLGSTNGTYVDNERVEEHTLTNQGEFRVGSHVLMFIITGLD